MTRQGLGLQLGIVLKGRFFYIRGRWNKKNVIDFAITVSLWKAFFHFCKNAHRPQTLPLTLNGFPVTW